MAAINSIRRPPVPAHTFDIDRWEDALALLKTAHRALEAVEHEPGVSIVISPSLRTFGLALRLLHTLTPPDPAR